MSKAFNKKIRQRTLADSRTCLIFSLMTIIDFAQVDFAYRENKVLSKVNFSLDDGDFVSIVGPNGGGKTTLLKLILGLLKPHSGTIKVFGERPAKYKRRIGYVPQFEKFDAAFPISVLDVVLLGRLRMRPWCNRDDFAAARLALTQLRIDDLAKQPFQSLSGGQKQRVLIARALCTGGDLLLLDEPTANLDRQGELELYNILSELNRERTILVISHNLEMVARVVRRVICVNRTVTTHQTAEIDHELLQQVFGGRVLIKHDCCEQCQT